MPEKLTTTIASSSSLLLTVRVPKYSVASRGAKVTYIFTKSSGGMIPVQVSPINPTPVNSMLVISRSPVPMLLMVTSTVASFPIKTSPKSWANRENSISGAGGGGIYPAYRVTWANGPYPKVPLPTVYSATTSYSVSPLRSQM